MVLTKTMVGPSVLLLLCLSVGMVHGQADEPAAAAALTEADSKVGLVFETLLEAEELGADASALRGELNVTCGLLATAHVCYGLGDLSEALFFAEQTLDGLERLDAEVSELVNSAVLERGRRLSFTVTVSVVAAILALLIGFLGWQYVKAWYLRRVLKMKPEVSDVDEHL